MSEINVEYHLKQVNNAIQLAIESMGEIITKEFSDTSWYRRTGKYVLIHPIFNKLLEIREAMREI